jgi:predicted Fe-Mo cluster-binding NifX family protein
MKIAIVTDDGQSISRHFGRALSYLVYTIEDGAVIHREVRAKPSHHHAAEGQHHDEHGHHEHHEHHEHSLGAEADSKHNQMLSPIMDCEAAIVRGMGRGAYLVFEQAGIRAYITTIENPDEAVRAYLDGTLTNHLEKLH